MADYEFVSNYIPLRGKTIVAFFLDPSRTRLYVANTTDESIDSFTLSTPGALHTASPWGSFSLVGTGVHPSGYYAGGFYITEDGSKMYTLGMTMYSVAAVIQYNLAVPWDISTAVYVGDGYSAGLSVVRVSPEGETIITRHIASGALCLEAQFSTPFDITSCFGNHACGDSEPYGGAYGGVYVDHTGSHFMFYPAATAPWNELQLFSFGVAWDADSLVHARTLLLGDGGDVLGNDTKGIQMNGDMGEFYLLYRQLTAGHADYGQYVIASFSGTPISGDPSPGNVFWKNLVGQTEIV